MALISNMPMFNPPRDEQLIDNLEHFSRLIPFGCSTAVNVLEFFQDEIFETNVGLSRHFFPMICYCQTCPTC